MNVNDGLQVLVGITVHYNVNSRTAWLTGELRKPPVADRARPRPLPVRQTARSIAAASAGVGRDEEPDDGSAKPATATVRNT